MLPRLKTVLWPLRVLTRSCPRPVAVRLSVSRKATRHGGRRKGINKIGRPGQKFKSVKRRGETESQKCHHKLLPNHV